MQAGSEGLAWASSAGVAAPGAAARQQTDQRDQSEKVGEGFGLSNGSWSLIFPGRAERNGCSDRRSLDCRLGLQPGGSFFKVVLEIITYTQIQLDKSTARGYSYDRLTNRRIKMLDHKAFAHE